MFTTKWRTSARVMLMYVVLCLFGAVEGGKVSQVVISEKIFYALMENTSSAQPLGRLEYLQGLKNPHSEITNLFDGNAHELPPNIRQNVLLDLYSMLSKCHSYVLSFHPDPGLGTLSKSSMVERDFIARLQSLQRKYGVEYNQQEAEWNMQVKTDTR